MEAAAINNEIADKNFTNYLHFIVENDSYALEVFQIREVLECSQMIYLTRIPMVHEAIMGIINIRGEIIPIIDLSMRLYNKKITLSPNSSIIILELEDQGQRVIVGVMADSAKGVYRISDSDITKTPGFGNKIRSDFISNFAMIGEEHVILLRIDTLLNFDKLSELSGIDIKDLLSMKAMQEDELYHSVESHEDDEDEEAGDELNYITIAIGDEFYGIEMSRVKEVIRITEMRSVPNSKKFMKGVINLRGKIIPVVDMRERCGLELMEYGKKTSILIVELKEFFIGLIVDMVNNVKKISGSKIQYPPHYTAKIDSDFINGISQIDDQIIINLDIDRILSPEEHEYIIKTDFDKNTEKEKQKK